MASIFDPRPRCLHSPRPGHAFRGPERSFTRKVRFTHFSHFFALLVDFNQGKHKPKWTFSFRSEKERKRASFLKMLKSALLDPANLKKRRPSVKNDALAVLTTSLKKFLKIFSRKITFCVSLLFPREKLDSGGSESTKRVLDEKKHFSLLFAPKWKCPFGLMFSLVEIDQKC